MMMLRTKASFDKVYSGMSSTVSLISCPILVPKVCISQAGVLEWKPLGVACELWILERFIELILGKIPRLRDDETGYGPRGRDFITYVALPTDGEMAWSQQVVTYKKQRQR
jgi:hypothetical protein